jgi:phage gp37-like protein
MIDAILSAACAHILALAGPGAPLGVIPRVEPYDGQINETTMPELLQRTPAVFVAIEAARIEASRSAWRWEIGLDLLVVTRNLASPRAAASGGPTGAPSLGAVALGEILALAFARHRLGLDIEPIIPTDLKVIVPGWLRAQKAALVGVSFTTAFSVEAAAEGDLVDYLRAQTHLAIGAGDDAYTDLVNTRSP